jgi:hypothetical protein
MESMCYLARMQSDPTPPEALDALSEVRERARAVRWADRRFRPILLVLAAFDLAVGVLLGLYPRGGWRYEGVVLLVIYVVAIVATAVLLRAGRVRSRAATTRFTLAIAAFSLWNGAVVAVSAASGWWAAGQPFHATVSFAVSALPLVVAAWLVGPRRP